MSSSHSALIVDADPKGLEALVYGFQGADWRTTACPTPETASLLVKASGAEIVVIASRTDHDKAHTLIRQVRSKETFRTLPLLVLGPEALRKPLKDSSDADLLPLPTFVRDVLTASQLLVEASAAAAQKPGDEPTYATPIAPVTTLSLIRTLCGLARSGQLQLERKGRHGEILFHEGELTAAQLGSLQGMAAVQHMLIWDDGASKLNLRPVARRGQLHQNAHEFIEEIDRFQRDFAHAMKDIGPSATVYARSEERLQHSGNAVPAEVTPVVRLCDGQRSLVDIIDESPFRVLDTVRILGRLVDLAILLRRDPKPETAKAKRAPLEEFWETAQIVGPASPRPSRSRIDITEMPTPPPVTPAAPVSPAPAPVVREAPPASSVGLGHKRKKTLEILPPSTPMPSPEGSIVRSPAEATQDKDTPPAPATPATNSLGAISWPPSTATEHGAVPALGAKQTITARLPILPPAPTLVPPPVSQPDIPVPQIPLQKTIAPAPLANLPVTGTMQDMGSSQAGTIRSPFLPETRTAVPGTQASGTIEPRERRSQSSIRAIPTRTSVVLDIAQLEISPTPAPIPQIHNPVGVQPVGHPVAKVTGEIQVAPSRKTARQMPAQTMSIQLDATLATPTKVASDPAETVEPPKTTPSPMRLTGDMKIPPSGTATVETNTSARTSASFQIDPGIAVASAATQTEKFERPSDDRPAAVTPEQRKQSGNFSPLEKDFFEREAELYKDEDPVSFADLDDKRAKTVRTNGAGKKSKRPNRK